MMKQNDSRAGRRTGRGSGAHNRSSKVNAELGRKGGQAEVPKGFATWDKAALQRVTAEAGRKSGQVRKKSAGVHRSANTEEA